MIARRSCGDCKKWVYDEQTGELKLQQGVPVARPPKVPTPCHKCPKRSPEEAPDFEISAKNLKSYELYLRLRANPSLLVNCDDRIIQRNMAEIDRIVREHEQISFSELLAVKVLTAGPKV